MHQLHAQALAEQQQQQAQEQGSPPATEQGLGQGPVPTRYPSRPRTIRQVSCCCSACTATMP
jgi:hypothetical protein